MNVFRMEVEGHEKQGYNSQNRRIHNGIHKNDSYCSCAFFSTSWHFSVLIATVPYLFAAAYGGFPAIISLVGVIVIPLCWIAFAIVLVAGRSRKTTLISAVGFTVLNSLDILCYIVSNLPVWEKVGGIAVCAVSIFLVWALHMAVKKSEQQGIEGNK